MQITPLGLAILMNNHVVAADLINAGASCYLDKNDVQKDLSPIFLAIEHDAIDLLEQMIDNGLDLEDIRNSKQESPILYAIQRKKQKSIDFLSWRSGNLNIEDKESMSILLTLLF